MDLEEWELLPDEGFLEINDDGSGKKIYSRNYNHKGSASVFQMNYFIPSPKSVEKTTERHHRRVPNQLLPVQIDHLEPANLKKDDDREIVKKVPKIPVEIKIIPSENMGSFATGLSGPGQDQDPVSQVFFKKMKETEKFVDMKVDSPRSGNGASRGIMPQIEGGGAFQFEEQGDPDSKMDMDSGLGLQGSDDDDDDDGGLNIWKWSLNGIGAICSFGVAAATVCIIVLSSHRKNKDRHQKLQFQIYATDKRMKQVVERASRLNEAISAVRGVPITRAHITVGGYYDAPL